MSQLRAEVHRLFDCFCEVSLPLDSEKGPVITNKYPDDFQEDGMLEVVPSFTFPCDLGSCAVEHFSFVVLQDLSWLYGFCRHAPRDRTALVMLSPLPWHATFYKLLDVLRQVAVTGGPALLQESVQTLYQTPVPEGGQQLSVALPDGTDFSSSIPNPRTLPSLLEDRNLTEYWSVVDDATMMEVFAALLHERHVIVTSSRVCRLSACAQAAQALLYPLWWQRIFLPVLPSMLEGALASPVPYLVGAPAALLRRLEPEEMAEGPVVLDCDTSRVTSPHGDLQRLPHDLVTALRRQLKRCASGDGVSRAFQTAVTQLLAGFRHGVRRSQEPGRLEFDHATFIASQPTGRRPFLRSLVQTQMFERFIAERLDSLPASTAPDPDPLPGDLASSADSPPPRDGLPRLKRWAALCSGRLRTRDLSRLAAPPLARSVPSSPATARPTGLGTSAPSLLLEEEGAPAASRPTLVNGVRSRASYDALATISPSPPDGSGPCGAAAAVAAGGTTAAAAVTFAAQASLIEEINAELHRRDQPTVAAEQQPLPGKPPIPPARRRRRNAQSKAAVVRSSSEELLGEYGLRFESVALSVVSHPPVGEEGDGSGAAAAVEDSVPELDGQRPPSRSPSPPPLPVRSPPPLPPKSPPPLPAKPPPARRPAQERTKGVAER